MSNEYFDYPINYTHCRGCGVEIPSRHPGSQVDGLCILNVPAGGNCTAHCIRWCDKHHPGKRDSLYRANTLYWQTQEWSVLIDDWLANTESNGTSLPRRG